MANKVVWPIVRRLRGKRSQGAFVIEGSNGVTLKDQDAILNRWRKYFISSKYGVKISWDETH